MSEKDLGITSVRTATANIPDLQVFGDGDLFRLVAKASSQAQGWMKSTKACNVPGGCVVQVTTHQRNHDGTNAVAEALTFVPGVHAVFPENGAAPHFKPAREWKKAPAVAERMETADD